MGKEGMPRVGVFRDPVGRERALDVETGDRRSAGAGRATRVATCRRRSRGMHVSVKPGAAPSRCLPAFPRWLGILLTSEADFARLFGAMEATEQARAIKLYNGRRTTEQMPCGSKLPGSRLQSGQLQCVAVALPEEVEHWSLTILRERPVKTGARIARYGRYAVFQLADVAVPAGAVREDPAPDPSAQPQLPPLPA